MEAQLADVKAENDMLYASEDRVKRLMDEIENLKGHIRMKDKDLQLLNERNSLLMDENLSLQRETKMKAQDQMDQQYQQQSEERVI